MGPATDQTLTFLSHSLFPGGQEQGFLPLPQGAANSMPIILEGNILK